MKNMIDNLWLLILKIKGLLFREEFNHVSVKIAAVLGENISEWKYSFTFIMRGQ